MIKNNEISPDHQHGEESAARSTIPVDPHQRPAGPGDGVTPPSKGAAAARHHAVRRTEGVSDQACTHSFTKTPNRRLAARAPNLLLPRK